MRVRRGSPLYNIKKIQGRGVRPRFVKLSNLKNKIFFRKEELGRVPLTTIKNTG
jgi:hypothetical protein